MRIKKRETKHEKGEKVGRGNIDERGLVLFCCRLFSVLFLCTEEGSDYVIASFLRKLLKLSEWRCEKLADRCW
jgi:hypothetical protein